MNILELVSEIKNRYPEIIFTDNSDLTTVILEFKIHFQTDYIYVIWLGTDPIEASVGARLVHEPLDQYFWHFPFDPYGSELKNEKKRDCMNFIFRRLDILTKYKTRILQKKGWFSQTFICEYFIEFSWVKLYQHTAFGVNFLAPTIIGKMKIYQ